MSKVDQIRVAFDPSSYNIYLIPNHHPRRAFPWNTIGFSTSKHEPMRWLCRRFPWQFNAKRRPYSYWRKLSVCSWRWHQLRCTCPPFLLEHPPQKQWQMMSGRCALTMSKTSCNRRYLTRIAPRTAASSDINWFLRILCEYLSQTWIMYSLYSP